jgi:hypothetical protein
MAAIEYAGKNPVSDREFLDGTRHVIYPWNQSQIENPQAPAFICGVNLKSKI